MGLMSTTYDVRIKYSVDNRAGASVRGLANEVRTLGRETGKVSSFFQRLGAVAIGAFGFNAAGKALVGFNSNIEGARIGIAGLLKLNLGGEFSKHTESANKMIGRFQQMAKQGIGETVDYVEMAKMITRPATAAGASLKELEQLTQGAVVASKAFGIQAEMAALDIEQALMGTLSKKDRFARALLEPMKMDTEKFNALSATDRFKTLYKAMTAPAIKEMADAYEQTFAGATSALKDNLSITFGKVGFPLMKRLTDEAKSWNKWIDSNTDKVDGWVKRLGDALVTGFGAVKDAVSFLVTHADLLIAVGKVWLATKIVGALGGAGGGVVGQASSLMAWGRKASDRFNPETGAYEYTPGGAGRAKVGFGNVLGNASTIAALGIGGYELGKLLGFDQLGSELGTAVAKLTGRYSEQEQALDRAAKGLDAVAGASRRYAEKQAVDMFKTQNVSDLQGLASTEATRANYIRDYLREQGSKTALDTAIEASGKMSPYQARMRIAAQKLGSVGLSESDASDANASYYDLRGRYLKGEAGATGITGAIAFEAGLDQLTEYQRRTLDVQKAQLQVSSYIQEAIQSGKAFDPAKVIEIMKNATDDPSGKKKSNIAGKPNVNITIQRIEVQSEDPDRYAFGLVEAFRDAVKDPSAAVRALREG